MTYGVGRCCAGSLDADRPTRLARNTRGIARLGECGARRTRDMTHGVCRRCTCRLDSSCAHGVRRARRTGSNGSHGPGRAFDTWSFAHGI